MSVSFALKIKDCVNCDITSLAHKSVMTACNYFSNSVHDHVKAKAKCHTACDELQVIYEWRKRWANE